MNTFKNEYKVKLGEKEILLRPTFDNIAALEGDLGGLSWLAWKFTQGARTMPSQTECVKIIFHSQALKEGEGHLSLDEIFDLVMDEGLAIVKPIMEFLTIVTAGNKLAPEMSDKQKKS